MDLVDIDDLTRTQLHDVLDRAAELKPGGSARPLADQTLGMIFEKPSTRTRVSFETGMTQLGGHAIFLGPDDIHLGHGEPIKDTARAVSRYVDVVMARVFDHADVVELAEYAAVPETKLARLPEDIPFEEGAAVANVGATAWTALVEVAGVRPGDRVLVHGGAGGVGHAAVQVAASAGADVVATAGSADARDRLRDLGATAVLDYESDSLAEDVLAATGDEGVETVLDHRLEEYLDLDFRVLAEGGEVVALMGHVPGTSGVPFYEKELTVRALRMDNHPVRGPTLERLVRLMERDDLTAVVADTYDLDEAARAHRDLLAGGYVGKLVVTP